MRKILLLLSISLLFMCFTCQDKDVLPPATQEGRNTFGFVIDDALFSKDWRYDNKSFHTADSTRLTNSGTTVGNSDFSGSIALVATDLTLEVGKTYPLGAPKDGQAHAELFIEYRKLYTTTNESKGEWTITKIDKENHIISGYFWFDIQTQEQRIYQVRRGRFDINYSNRNLPVNPI